MRLVTYRCGSHVGKSYGPRVSAAKFVAFSQRAVKPSSRPRIFSPSTPALERCLGRPDLACYVLLLHRVNASFFVISINIKLVASTFSLDENREIHRAKLKAKQVSENYGAILRRFRKMRELRLVDFSRLSNLDVGYLSRIETGDRSVPGPRTRTILQSALRLSNAEIDVLEAAVYRNLQTSATDAISMRSGDGAVIILPGKDILRLLMALDLKPTVLISKGEPEM